MLIVAFSGGKDSCAMALGLKERGQEFKLLFTPTGDELPELTVHLAKMVELLGVELILPSNKSLYEWIDKFNMLPSQKSRWCTRAIKIEPCIHWFRQNPGHTLAVGLRADEEERLGLFSDLVTSTFPMRDWGWGLKEVNAKLEEFGVKVPARTDCALCPYQRMGEWYRLWKYERSSWDRGVELERRLGHSFRSPTQRKPRKDGSLRWAVRLEDLAKQFEAGDKPRGLTEEDEMVQVCRVCRL